MRQAIEAVRDRLAVEHDPLEGEGGRATVMATNSLAQAIAAPQTHALAVFVGEDAEPRYPLRFARREVRPIDLLHGLLKTGQLQHKHSSALAPHRFAVRGLHYPAEKQAPAAACTNRGGHRRPIARHCGEAARNPRPSLHSGRDGRRGSRVLAQGSRTGGWTLCASRQRRNQARRPQREHNSGYCPAGGSGAKPAGEDHQCRRGRGTEKRN